MIHESGLGIGIFFLSVSSLISLGLIIGGGPEHLSCLFSLPESWFSPLLRVFRGGGMILGMVLLEV